MFSHKQTTRNGGWSNWNIFGSPVNIAAGDVLSSTISTTKWIFNQLKDVAVTATGDLSSQKQTSQRAEALSVEELKHLEKVEEADYLERLKLNLPPMAQFFNDFEIQEKNDVRCFHQIFTVTKEGKTYFYKKNIENCPMSELEAYCRAAVDLIAHGHVPRSAIPVYDEKGQFIGLCSEGIPGFQSIIKNPFSANDFKVDVLDKKIMTLSMLKKLDRFARERHMNLHRILKARAVDIDEWAELEDADEIVHREQVDLIHDVVRHEAWLKSPDAMTDNPLEIVELVKKVAQDLINFRYVKGFAITHTARLEIHDEDDLHRNNIGVGEMENGVTDVCSIDFDMAKWGILYAYKKSGIIDNYTRDPSSSGLIFRVPTGRFVKTRNDFSRLPNIQDTQAFYRPVADIPTVPERVKGWISWGLSWFGIKDFDITTYVSTNAYREEDKKAFSELTLNPVYIHYKFKTLLKYILTDPTLYENLARLCVREDIMHEGKKIRDVLRECEKENLEVTRQELYNMGYDLQLTYAQEPNDNDIQPSQLYLYLDSYGSIMIKAENSRENIETLMLTPQMLGDRYDAIKAVLASQEKLSLNPQDLEVLAGATAKLGYAQKNTMYEFKQFLRDYGDEVKQEIIEEFNDLNKVYGGALFDIEHISKECSVLIGLADDHCVSSDIIAGEIFEALNFNRIR